MKAKTLLLGAAALMMSFVLPGQADARRPGGGGGGWNGGGINQLQRVRIPVNQHYQGQNTIRVKAMVARHTGLNLQEYDLAQVNLVAKSARGRGQAQLLIAQQLQDQVTVMSSNDGRFWSERPASFNPHMLIARNGRPGRPGNPNLRETWQIGLRGNIRVKNLVVFIQRKVQNERLRLELPMNTIVRGQQEFGLKRQLRQRYPNLRLRNYEIKRVVLRAKSRRGMATAELFVAHQSQDMSRIAAAHNDFHSPGGFDRVVLRNHDRFQQRGPWRLGIRGRVNLNKIVVVLKPVR